MPKYYYDNDDLELLAAKKKYVDDDEECAQAPWRTTYLEFLLALKQ